MSREFLNRHLIQNATVQDRHRAIYPIHRRIPKGGAGLVQEQEQREFNFPL